MSGSVGVIGAYHTPARKDASDVKLEELIFEAARGALADAQLGIEDIDAIVISTADQSHGRVIESMVTAGAVGAVGRDLTAVPSAGEHAFVYAWLRLLAGQSRRILTVCWGKPSEAKAPRHTEVVAAEPFLLRPFGMNMTLAAALQANAYTSRFGMDWNAVEALRAARTQAARKSHGLDEEWFGLSEDFVAWPLTVRDLPTQCDMAAAAVLVSDDQVTGESAVAWISGIGWASDGYDLGSRDLSQFTALKSASQRALGESGHRGSVDVLEVEEISSFGGFAACEALGLASPGRGSTVAVGQSPVVNPSGGNLPINPGNASGYMRFLEAAQQVRGCAGHAQVEPLPQTAVAAALHGYCGQGATVVGFSAERRVA